MKFASRTCVDDLTPDTEPYRARSLTWREGLGAGGREWWGALGRMGG
jgi:hypothetical protein